MKKFFPKVKDIVYEGNDSKNPLAFKEYNPDEVIAGKTMREHMRFGVAYWHTMKGSGGDQFGAATYVRGWDKAATPMKQAEDTLVAAFEFFTKLGVDYYCLFVLKHPA